jgi:hypothetical protein
MAQLPLPKKVDTAQLFTETATLPEKAWSLDMGCFQGARHLHEFNDGNGIWERDAKFGMVLGDRPVMGIYTSRDVK